MVPMGGKGKLRIHCMTNHKDLFGSRHPFDDAWKEGARQQRIRMADHDRFRGQKG
jgi:hypothetical protein